VFDRLRGGAHGPSSEAEQAPGRNQAGVGVCVRSTTGRVRVQCKKYKEGSLQLKHVTDEIEKAEARAVRIVLLTVATTAANGAKLLAEVMA
jgi:hypothetical protein